MCAQRFHLSLNPSDSERRQEGEETHIALLVDLPFAASGGIPVKVDWEHAQQVQSLFQTSLDLQLEIAGRSFTQTLTIDGDPENLEPDALAGQIGVVLRLQALRKALKNNQGADAAVKELAEILGTEAPAAESVDPAPDAAADDSFEALLSGSRDAPKQSEFVSRLLADTDLGAHPDRSEQIEACDALINDVIAQVLANPSFRQIERPVRAVTWLLQELNLDEDLSLWILPANLAQPDAGELTEAFTRITRGAEGGSLAALAVDAEFDGEDGIERLAGLARIAQQLATTLLCKAPPGLAVENSPLVLEAGYQSGSADLLSAWQTFRESPEAAHCAAVLPRIQLRPPYGSRGEGVYLPGFEELPARPGHERFFWVNPVYALVYLLGGASADGLTVEDLPMPIYDDGTGDAVMPCAETYLSEGDVAGLQQRGVMVLQSHRNRNAVTLSGFSTVS
jgi:type VI secretion system protein ImpC